MSDSNNEVVDGEAKVRTPKAIRYVGSAVALTVWCVGVYTSTKFVTQLVKGIFSSEE